nr:unnamed protein product [Callosobruchus analis]
MIILFAENKINDVNVYTLHPGVIKTEIGRHLSRTFVPGLSTLYGLSTAMFFKSVKQGAQTTIYCALHDDCAHDTGLYYKECKVAKPSKLADDRELAEELWNTSWKLVGLDDNYNPFKK